MSERLGESGIQLAVFMPHAPVLVPGVSEELIGEVAQTVESMRIAARRLMDSKPDSMVVVSPHSPRRLVPFGIWGGSQLQGNLETFAAPEVKVDLPNDVGLIEAIVSQAGAWGVSTWKIEEPQLDHGAVVPLCFMAEAGWRGPTVVVSLNALGAAGVDRFGRAVAAAATSLDRRVALLASGDMSHRLTQFAPCGYEPRAAEFDEWLMATILRGDYRALEQVDEKLQSLAGEDALESVLLAAGATDWDSTGHQVLSYEGPFGVGYGVAILYDATVVKNPVINPTMEAL